MAHGCVAAGQTLSWRDRETVSIWVDSSGSVLRAIDAEEALGALERAAANWNQAKCSNGEAPALRLVAAGTVEGAVPGDDSAQPDMGNVVVFHDSVWPYDASVAAYTSVSFVEKTGEILDADIEVNTESFPFAVDAESGQIDLEAVLTHELGHVLGLDHTNVKGATMQPESDGFGLPSLQTLEMDDVQGVCAIYTPFEFTKNDPEEAEYEGRLGEPATTGPCSTASSQMGRRADPASLALFGMLLLLLRRIR